MTPLGIIAGRGGLPIHIADTCSARGEAVFVIRLEGLADPSLDRFAGIDLSLGQFGAVFEALTEAGCERVVFGGYVIRPDFASITFDERGQSLLPRIIEAAGKGDNDSLSLFARIFEEEGFSVLGIKDACPEIVCPAGALTITAPDDDVQSDLSKAWDIAGIMGREDIGQACVVREGIVVAVEAQEGTDRMLARAATIDVDFQGAPPSQSGVLVKRAKAGQDLRLDLPVIGPQTVERVAGAGLKGIGVEAGASIILERGKTIATANDKGIFIVGLTDETSGNAS